MVKKPKKEGSVMADLKVWRTIELGTFSTGSALCDALKEGGFLSTTAYLGKKAARLLRSSEFCMSRGKRSVDLVVLSGADLGVKKSDIRREIYGRGRKLGLELCPAEVGPQLRLQYPDQPEGETLNIAMAAVGTEGELEIRQMGYSEEGVVDVFVVYHDRKHGKVFEILDEYPDGRFGPRNLFVFVLPRKSRKRRKSRK